LEVSDASATAVEAIKRTGGTVTCIYKTPNTLRYLLKPHKYERPIKDPMPDQKLVIKMEKRREKGVDVVYPPAPWYPHYVERKAIKEQHKAERKALKGQTGMFPETIPVSREKGASNDRPRVQRKEMARRLSPHLEKGR